MEAHERMREAYDTWLDSLVAVARTYRPDPPPPSDLLRVGIDAASKWIRLHTESVLRSASALCESPIEEMMLYALAGSGEIRIKVGPEGRTVPLHPCARDVVVEPQARIGEFRVDFLITQRSIVPERVHHTTMEVLREEEREARMVVECDGHDFHERTKQQAANDRSRDRELQRAGFLVFRFTGSEIWKDPMRCAGQALSSLERATYGLKE